MKTSKTRLAVLLVSTLLLLRSAYAQFTPSADAYTLTSSPAVNFGSKNTLLVESSGATTFIRLDLSSIPPSVTGSMVAKGTLKIYVSTVTTAGSFNVDLVTSSWTEGSITANNSPTLGSAIASAVAVTTSDKNQYVLVDVTTAVVDWLNGTTNDGLALVPDGTVSFAVNSKETTTTSHPAELDIVFTGSGGGGITGINTASGSGLIGGGTSGTLNLSLNNACAANQVLQWNGSAWICAAVGMGTITSVTAGTDLTGGGASGNVTLNLNTANVPQLATANTFTGNQTVNGNLTATGVVTGSSYQIGSNLFAFGSYSGGNAFLGFAGNTGTGSGNVGVGPLALASNNGGINNTATGNSALNNNGDGCCNTANGFSSLINNTNGSGNTALGYKSGETSDNSHITGFNNTVLGANTGIATGTLSNATAIGAYAEASASNVLVLGSINGLNGADASVSVGIGTTAPAATLDVRDNGSGGNTISAISGAVNNAVYGSNTSTSGNANGASFWTASPQGTAVVGVNTATTGNHYAGYFEGNVEITGTLSKGSGSFKIDHPLDPANKYLYHSFVESPDMMNIYNGVVTLDAQGSVWITMPEYFEALNEEFRYQLTSIGRPQPSLYVAREISGNRFRISGGKPGGKVSWQVTGIRHDAYADANRIQVEVEKPPQEQGRYLHPELFGAPAGQAIGYHAPSVTTKPPAQDETAHMSSLKIRPPR